MKAIETRYAGCRFRSRLEARWAVFFDALEVPWEYELESFELEPISHDDTLKFSSCWGPCQCAEHLGGYIPDFWLPSLSTWFEVKGVEPDEEAVAKLHRFELLAEHRLVIAIGGIPDPRYFDMCGQPLGPANGGDGDFDIWLSAGSDYHYAWCLCWKCGKPGVEFDARSGRICRHDDDDKRYNGDDRRILKAYAAARSARFEHEEKERWS